MTDSEKIKKINDIIKNHENLYKKAVKIEDLPPDDDWIQDDVWDEVYQQEVIKKKDQAT